VKMRNMTIAVLGTAAALAGCAEDGAVTPKGGQAFEVPFTSVTPVKFPGMVALAYGRTVNNAAVVDSIVGEVTLLKLLDNPARYQFYLVNGLDSSATPISHRQWVIRTDSVLDATGTITTPVDTAPNAVNRPTFVRDYWRGEFFGRKLRFAIPLSPTDSVHQRAGWLVLTIQRDSARTSYNDTTPRPLFVRFRDQKGTATRDDDAIPSDTLRGNFGEFLSPTRQTRYAAGGNGTLLFWDVISGGNPAIRVDFAGLSKPPRGYYYQPFIIDSISGNAFAWGQVYDAAEKPLGNADVGTALTLPTLRAVQPVSPIIGKAENYTNVSLILEPKSAPPPLLAALANYSLMTVQRANIPSALVSKRAALGRVQAIVTRGTQGGPVAPNVGVVILAPGNNFNTLIGNRNSDSLGVATFNNVPVGEVRVIAIPFGGGGVEARVTIVSGQLATVRLAVP